MNNQGFETIGAQAPWIEALAKLNISEATPIQAQSFGLVSEGGDLIAQAMTGSGKTFAYLLPLFHKIDVTSKNLQVVILTPTHELSLQINEQIKLLVKAAGVDIRSQALIGGVKLSRQADALKEKPHILVGSAGRMLDLVKLKKLKTHFVKTIVLDEGDKLLEDSHIKDLKAIIKTTQRDRQLLLFSASLSDRSRTRAEEMMKSPDLLVVEAGVLNPLVAHAYWLCDSRKKVENIRKLVSAVKPTRCIIFVNKNELIQDVTSKLNYHHYPTTSLFGNQSKEERAKAMKEFTTGKVTLLVTSEMASRGLDIKGVTHVINFDMPVSQDDYMHRIGRTGRHGKPGMAISVVDDYELGMLEKYVARFNVALKNIQVAKGEMMDKYEKME
ncbi:MULTISPECIES: DEAD/DEAH box helicase [unclassified Fusibacter]|uniref:DEAD/DEAH box helicase n=1 Tax=unclassified Fusibacter TaxID=2624464 RepID=UPI00101331F6|nr:MULTISPECIES: DEAD/DEAH box helicase [unclassified Fusibacter]MCK8060425.1 DEAD/DEAH box helicase [Fusibacter sp. A2]NPE20286.1 DEAD/DEAH box helicase [Fusibacter sp. A1]RXV63492.1 ATP-dependent helicase [Fusibacter sp. A1]